MGNRLGHRGSVLIVSYLVLSLFLVYSNVMLVQTSTQRQASDRHREQLQALDVAQGALEQLRDSLNTTLTTRIYQGTYFGDAVKAFEWLDSQMTAAPIPPVLSTFMKGQRDDPLCLQDLPTVKPNLTCEKVGTALQAPRAWITKIGKQPNPDNPNQPDPSALAPRLVTMEVEATVGQTTKHLQATYTIELGMSDIFRYAYFVNNYGWFDVSSTGKVVINGEVRANGNLDFLGNISSTTVNGDLYASTNIELSEPGTISGDPMQRLSQLDYWTSMAQSVYPMVRPTRNLTLPGQPAIGGVPTVLPYGFGWDSDYPTVAAPDQRRFQNQPIHPIPYIGNLADPSKPWPIRDLAIQYHEKGWPLASYGGKLAYYDGTRVIKKGVYYGPDQTAGTADDTTPLILVGTKANPIILNGPVVVPGDVIIKGYVSGQGTIYAGRNIHIVGPIQYTAGPSWPQLERNTATGQIREKGQTSGLQANLGTVANDGTYTPPAGAPPKGAPCP